jgi:hypothetical protein
VLRWTYRREDQSQLVDDEVDDVLGDVHRGPIVGVQLSSEASKQGDGRPTTKS